MLVSNDNEVPTFLCRLYKVWNPLPKLSFWCELIDLMKAQNLFASSPYKGELL
jgi:hypothetical protein